MSRPAGSWRKALSWRRLIPLLVLGIAFVVGIGFGEALHDQPDAGGTQTLIRTLQPLPVTPISPETVTVTTTVP
jgi:hypothetical protein